MRRGCLAHTIMKVIDTLFNMFKDKSLCAILQKARSED